MTSQVALLNPHGVALASDSAVSLGAKTFNTVSKIFPLKDGKESHKVAFMISNAGIYIPGGVHWDRVFDEFASTLRRTPPTVEKYVEKFCNYLKSKNHFDEKQNNIAVQRLLVDWFMGHPTLKGLESLERNLRYTGSEEVDEMTNEMREAISKGLTSVIDQLFQECVDDDNRSIREEAGYEDRRNRILGYHNTNSQTAAQHIIDQHNFDIAYLDQITEILNIRLFQNPAAPKRDTSTIVAVGFGHADETPVMCEMTCGALIDHDAELVTVKEWFRIRKTEDLHDAGQLIAEKDDGVLLNKAGAFVRGYAYKNEMDNVLNGIHWEDMRHLRGGFPNYLSGTILQTIYDAVKDTKGIGDSTMKRIWDSVNPAKISDLILAESKEAIDWGMINRRQRFRMAIENFPMPNLANFAHSLVRMEAEICYWMSPVRAVGGPIDVLVITKEDGCQLEARS